MFRCCAVEQTCVSAFRNVVFRDTLEPDCALVRWVCVDVDVDVDGCVCVWMYIESKRNVSGVGLSEFSVFLYQFNIAAVEGLFTFVF